LRQKDSVVSSRLSLETIWQSFERVVLLQF
jgi:hypothetical protein